MSHAPVAPSTVPEFWRALLRRWFIEYNPLFLVSATLVLVGTTLISHAVSQHSLHLGGIAVGGIAEVYAFALIGGAAFLTRIRQHRPAALLALLAVVFQCDLTLQAETYAYYGWVGQLASAAWVAVFVAKLYALARALRLRLSLSGLAVATLGAAGLAATPHIAGDFDPQTRTALVSLWLFTLGAAGLWTSRAVRADFELDPRARRAISGTWALWAAAVLVHALFWGGELHIELVGLLPALALLASRWMKRELAVWGLIALVLVLVGAFLPFHLSMTALMSAAVLVLRALRRPTRESPNLEPSLPTEPYRTPGAAPVFEAPPPPPAVSFVRESLPAMGRLCVGALTCNYLCVWTYGWSGGAAPEHRIWLDVIFVGLAAALYFGLRARSSALPVIATLTHFGVQLGWLVSPRGALEVGAATIGAGFVVLFGSLVASWYLGREPGREPGRDPGPGVEPPLIAAGRPPRP